MPSILPILTKPEGRHFRNTQLEPSLSERLSYPGIPPAPGQIKVALNSLLLSIREGQIWSNLICTGDRLSGMWQAMKERMLEINRQNYGRFSTLRCEYNRVLEKTSRLYQICCLTRRKTGVILRIFFKHALFHRLSYSWQAITCTNRIWPDLAFGFVNKTSGYEITLPSLHDYQWKTTTWKSLISRFVKDVNTQFPELRYSL